MPRQHTDTHQFFIGEITFDLVYTFWPGAPERPPAYDHGGLPADPPEVEITDIFINGDDASRVWDLLPEATHERAFEEILAREAEA